MVDFTIGYKEKRWIITIIAIIATFAINPFTASWTSETILKIGIPAMPNFLSIGMLVSVVLALVGWASIKNRI